MNIPSNVNSVAKQRIKNTYKYGEEKGSNVQQRYVLSYITNECDYFHFSEMI